MKDFDALKDLWSGQNNGPRLAYEDILRDVRNSRSSLAGKLRIEALAMFASVLFFAWVWTQSSFLMWTTHLSIAILIICCLYYFAVQVINYKRLSSTTQILQKPETYISFLQSYQQERYTFNTRNFRIYSYFIGMALALFAIELYYVSAWWQSVLGIVFTIAWFIMCRKLMITYRRREQERLKDMITKLEEIRKQFD